MDYPYIDRDLQTILIEYSTWDNYI